jgi:hypothetical protein
MKEVQIYEVADTNLLYVVTDANSDATYYTKTNLEVEAVDGFVVLRNEGIEVLKELPKHFVSPVESSVVDMVEIIQGYINNVIPANQEEVALLKDLVDGQKIANSLLDLIKLQANRSEEIINELKIMNAHLSMVNGQEIHL